MLQYIYNLLSHVLIGYCMMYDLNFVL